MNDKVIQLVRTGVQALMTWLLAKLVAWPILHSIGLELADEAESFLTQLAIVAYVAGVRALTTKYPWLGWLNGYPTAPTYTPTDS